jgi:hypothetical protein
MLLALLMVKNLFSCEENPKHEYRNPKQIQKLQKENPQRLGRVFRRFQFWALRFVSDFGFRISNLAAAAGCGVCLAATALAAADWPAAVPDWDAPQPDEHPRLFFRKADVAALRQKAATPEGQALVRRLRQLLNGSDGETMPAHKRPTDAPFGDKSREMALPEGAYSIGHAAGYGMLFQLTGEKKYADLGRQCFEWAFAGVRDCDGKGRYSWREPSGALRAGPSVGWYAVGYDLCHGGWDEEFRQRVARAILDYEKGTPHCNLDDLARGKRQHPGSNHWGAEIGGAGLALLAIRGDAGVDAKRVEQLLAANEKCVLRQLTSGWGDHGWFAEGDGPGAISSDTAFVPALQAWRVAAGRDFITPRPNAQWLTLKWLMLSQVVANPTKQNVPHRGTYDHNVWTRRGLSGSGTFAQGFGAIAEEAKPALLWLYQHTFQAADEKAGAPCDTVSPYPHRAVLALVNWPLGLAEKYPGEVLPCAVEDKAAAFYMFRNRWKDADDIIVTALLRGSRGNYSVAGGDILVWGLGQKTKFPVRMTGEVKKFVATKRGGALGTALGSFAVDFGDGDAVLVLSGPIQGTPKGATVVEVGGAKFTIMTLQRGAAPMPKVEGVKVLLAGRTITLADGLVNIAH